MVDMFKQNLHGLSFMLSLFPQVASVPTHYSFCRLSVKRSLSNTMYFYGIVPSIFDYMNE